MKTINSDFILKAYAAGVFPMSDSRDAKTLFWVDPETRGVIPLDRFHIPRKLARLMRSKNYAIRIDKNFDHVIDACADATPKRTETWINAEIKRIYRELFYQGHCHTVEVYDGGALIGGLYGIHLGGAFFGETMFHHETGASKIALVHLVARLKKGNFSLLDAQFITPHLAQFGAEEISRETYLDFLQNSLTRNANFYVWPPEDDISCHETLDAFTK